VYGPNGEIVGQDDDSGGRGNAELAAVLPVEGQYTVVATRFGRQNGASSGRYEILLSGGTGDTAGVTAPITRPKPPDFAGLPELQYGQANSGPDWRGILRGVRVRGARGRPDHTISMEPL
jgi:hypothetical protein